ncbi:hypothetical protein STENM327S_09297 [Streptomyces tendae]
MHAMQYTFTLPADFPVDVIRERVARTGHLLDDWPGLGLKAYLIREREKDGSPGQPVRAVLPVAHRGGHELLPL